MKLSVMLFFGLGLSLLLSCKKDLSSSSKSSLNGNYKFLSMEAITSSTIEIVSGPDREKSVTLSHYITKYNTGTLVISPSTMVTNNISYSIDTTVMTYSYSNDVLNDSTTMPFQFNVTPTSSSASYTMVGSDSAYFSSGSMFSSGVAQPTIPMGVKFKTIGSKLYMNMRGRQSNSQTSQGAIINTLADVNSVVTLEKQ